MRRNYFLINLLLLAVIGALGFRFYKVWTSPVEMAFHDVKKDFKEEKKEVIEKKAETKNDLKLNEPDYNVIVQKDLFRPSRSIPPVVQENAEQFIPSPKLYGTIITNKEKGAILEDPISKTKNFYRINDAIAGFSILDIQEDKVVLLRGEKRTEVKLREIKTITLPRQQLPSAPVRQPVRGENLQQLPSPSRPPRVPPPPRIPVQSPPLPLQTTDEKAKSGDEGIKEGSEEQIGETVN